MLRKVKIYLSVMFVILMLLPSAAMAKAVIPTPTLLTVTPSDVTLNAGQVQQLSVVVSFSDGSTRKAGAVYTVSDKKIASVAGGKIKGLSPGETSITVKSYGMVSVVNVTVNQAIPTPTLLTVTPNTMNLQAGQSQQFTATLKFSDGSVKDVTQDAVYTISNKKIISLNGDNINALSAGKATLTIKSYGKSAKISINVSAASTPQPPSSDGVLNPVNATGSVKSKDYQWKFNDKTYKWHVEIPKSLYDNSVAITNTTKTFYQSSAQVQQAMLKSMTAEMKSLVLAPSAQGGNNLTPWVKESTNLSYLKNLTNSLTQMAQTEGYDRYKTADFVLSFVQNIPNSYQLYPQLSVKTLIDGGDCDGKSVLYSALLKNMGYKNALLFYSPASLGKSIGHDAVGVALSDSEVKDLGFQVQYYTCEGTKYYTAETTKNNLRLAQSNGYTASNIFPVN